VHTRGFYEFWAGRDATFHYQGLEEEKAVARVALWLYRSWASAEHELLARAGLSPPPTRTSSSSSSSVAPPPLASAATPALRRLADAMARLARELKVEEEAAAEAAEVRAPLIMPSDTVVVDDAVAAPPQKKKKEQNQRASAASDWLRAYRALPPLARSVLAEAMESRTAEE
jgi:hypothetical protein